MASQVAAPIRQQHHDRLEMSVPEKGARTPEKNTTDESAGCFTDADDRRCRKAESSSHWIYRATGIRQWQAGKILNQVRFTELKVWPAGIPHPL